jgi:translation initiation factor 2B subunit (eIF-2B alpha/beta/delta family)
MLVSVQSKKVTASGGALLSAGSSIVTSAAAHHSTPVVICACTYSLTTEYLNAKMDKFSHCAGPESIYGFENSILSLIQVKKLNIFMYQIPHLIMLIRVKSRFL